MVYDGIILGSGHNSLVLQAYLGRAGLKVLCLERRHVPGGGLSTDEDVRNPGFLHNTHSPCVIGSSGAHATRNRPS